MFRFKFADIGEGIHEGKVGEILVKVGDSVTDGKDIIVVETDKVTTPIASPVDGVISEILVKVGDNIHVGQDLFVIQTDMSSPVAKEPANDQNKEEAASVVGEVKVSNDLLPSFGNQMADNKNHSTTTVLASPTARILAKNNGIDITTIQGSGPLQRVLKEDVLNAINNHQSNKHEHKVTAFKDDQVIETSSIRKAIAKAMKESWNNVAYTNLSVEIDVTELWDQRNKFKDYVLKQEGVKLTLLPFIVKAIAKVLEIYPVFNAHVDEANNRIIQKANINIGIAIDTNDGLIVPNIKDVNQLSILEIAMAINDLAQKARSKKIQLSDLSNGTFSISNYGSLGVDFGVPVIKYPEIAIIGIGTLNSKVKKDGLHFVERKVMHLTMAADHRWVDGGDIGRFLSKVKHLLENFTLLFI